MKSSSCIGLPCKAFLASLLFSSFCTGAVANALYHVRLQGDALVASPGQMATVQTIRIIESTDCRHKVVGDNRIEIQGPCNYLSALYHYVPTEGAGGSLQVTGGFSFSRKSSASYVLAVAKAMQFYPTPVERKPVAPAPRVKMRPIPKEWLPQEAPETPD